MNNWQCRTEKEREAYMEIYFDLKDFLSRNNITLYGGCGGEVWVQVGDKTVYDLDGSEFS